MNYAGVIIEESLKDTRALEQLKIVSTKVEPVTEQHKTSWLSRWTLHTVDIPADRADSVANQLGQAIEDEHHAWYIDFKNDTTHYIIFPGKVFKVDRTKKAAYLAATDYGLTLGIPDYQLDFSPHIVHWQRPASA